MKNKFTLLTAMVFICVISPLQASATIDAYFSPYDDLERQWIEVIDSAHESIKISCFGLTNENIYNALIKKRSEGLSVLVLEDKMQSGSRHDKRDSMKRNRIEVVVKKVQVLEHNKMIVIDGKTAIVGSWNLSGNAQKQDNSIVVMANEPELAKRVDAAIERIHERDK